MSSEVLAGSAEFPPGPFYSFTRGQGPCIRGEWCLVLNAGPQLKIQCDLKITDKIQRVPEWTTCRWTLWRPREGQRFAQICPANWSSKKLETQLWAESWVSAPLSSGLPFSALAAAEGASCLSPTLAAGLPVRAEVAPEGTAGGQLAADSQLPRVGTPHLFASPSCRQLSFCH